MLKVVEERVKELCLENGIPLKNDLDLVNMCIFYHKAQVDQVLNTIKKLEQGKNERTD